MQANRMWKLWAYRSWKLVKTLVYTAQKKKIDPLADLLIPESDFS